MGQVSQATGSSNPMGSPMGSLANGLSRRADPISILYFTTFLPAFSAIWRRRYPLFRTLDTGKLSLFSLRRPGMEHCPIVRALLNKLSLIQGPCAEAERPCMRPGFFDSSHHLSEASVRSGASRSSTYHGVLGSQGCRLVELPPI